MVFTGYQQPPFFNLHGIYRVLTAPLFQFTWYLQDLDSPLFQFTWYLQCYLQDLDSPPFLIYAVFTGSRQPPFLDLHDIYRISTASLFQFTWYLQGLDSPPFSIYVVFTGSRQPPFSIYVVFTMLFTGSWQPPFFNLHGIYMICVLLPYSIYSIFLSIYMFQRQNLHDIYSIF